jgi:Ala-tRNA(Pro) deacylase
MARERGDHTMIDFTKYHPIVKMIIDLLETGGFWFETFEHEAVRTSEQAALTRPGYTLHQGAKALLIKSYEASGDRFVMMVTPADLKMDSRKAENALNAKKLRFASETEVGELTSGVLPGGVPPFGNVFNLPVYADPSLFENEKIVFNAGDRGFSIAMKSADYKTLVNPNIISIV